MRIIFMGTPAFALPAFEALLDSSHEVVAAYNQPPRAAGRGMKLTKSPIHALAEKKGIPVFTPEYLRPAETQQQFAAHKADIAVVAAYGLLLPARILEAPKLGCINIHPSNLPRWRGAAPIQRTIMAGDTTTTCCIMQMDEGLDTGAVLARAPFTIPATMTSGGLHDAMAKLGAELLLTTLGLMAKGKAHATPQSRDGVTYATKITREDRLIDWDRPAAEIVNQIRGLTPTPGALAKIKGENLKIFVGKAEKGDAKKPAGTVLDKALLINCGSGSALRVTELQRAGKSRQSAQQFLQGFDIPPGTHAERLIHIG